MSNQDITIYTVMKCSVGAISIRQPVDPKLVELAQELWQQAIIKDAK